MEKKIESKIIVPLMVEMMHKRQIRIDVDEVEKVLAAISSGKPVMVKQGLIVPSFIADIVVDEDRYKELIRQKNEVDKHNKFDKEYNEGKDQRKYVELQPLQDIFEGMKKLNQKN